MNLPRLALLAAGLYAAAHAQNTEPRPTVIESDQLDMRSTETETISDYSGHVVVTGTNLRLTCEYLRVVVLRKADPTATIGKFEKFRSLLATGNVNLVQGDREAACGRAEVLPAQNQIILTEHPVIVDHEQNSRISGEKITLLRGQHQVLVDKPVLAGPPVKDLGFDKDKPAPEAAPAAPAEKKP
ncbi:MAG: LptA/OstA family protein [Opitutales bacterium]